MASDPLDLLYALTLDNGRRWGELATSVQRQNAAAVLDVAGPRLSWVEAPKGYSKTTDTAALSLVWLACQAPGLAEGFVVASDEEQANRLLGAARGLIARSKLGGALRVEARRIVHVGSGARVTALASDAPGSEGLLSPWLVADEVPRWPNTRSAKAMWTSVFSAQPKWPGGARLLVLGHAGDPAHWSWRLRERARTSPRWRFVRVPGPTPWLSAEDLGEQRALLLPSEYAQRHQNRWTASEDRLTTREDLAACVSLAGPQEPRSGVRYVVSLDMAYVNDAAVAAIMHAEAGRVVLDRIEVWQGSRRRPVREEVVEAWLSQAHREYNRALVRLDPWQTKGLAQRLCAEGVRVDEFTFSAQSVGRLALVLFRVIREHRLALWEDELLLDELSNVELRQTAPGVYRMDHAAGGHDDRAVALALAAEWLEARPVAGESSMVGAGVLAAANLLSGVWGSGMGGSPAWGGGR